MGYFRQVTSIFLIFALIWTAGATTFDKIRYNGGTVSTNVDPEDWHNQLTVASDRIVLALKDGQSVNIDPTLVSNLSYGQEAHRRVGTMVALGILLTPIALFGLFHKTRLHYIGVEYKTADGKNAGLLIQAHKDNYRAVLQALRGATHAPISVSEEDRKYIASAVGDSSLQTAPASAQPAPPGQASTGTTGAAPAASPATTPTPAEATAPGAAGATTPAPASPAVQGQPEKGTIILATTPPGASVFVNESFAGQTPARLRLAPGKYRIRLFLQDYKEWAQEIEVFEGSEVNLQIELKK